LSKKKRKNILLGIIAAVLITLVIGYNYSAEQTKIKGFNFGNNLLAIQEDLKKIETDFQSEITIFQEGETSLEEFLEYSNMHISKIEELILRYDNLDKVNLKQIKKPYNGLKTKTKVQKLDQTHFSKTHLNLN